MPTASARVDLNATFHDHHRYELSQNRSHDLPWPKWFVQQFWECRAVLDPKTAIPPLRQKSALRPDQPLAKNTPSQLYKCQKRGLSVLPTSPLEIHFAYRVPNKNGSGSSPRSLWTVSRQSLMGVSRASPSLRARTSTTPRNPLLLRQQQ